MITRPAAYKEFLRGIKPTGGKLRNPYRYTVPLQITL